MKLIPTIKITEDEFSYQTTNQVFADGGESIICHTETPKTLDKFFVEQATRKLIPMPDNKISKVSLLYQIKPEQTIQPLALIAKNGIIIGYRMHHPEHYKTLEKAKLTRKTKVRAIRQSQEVLERLNSQDITYADIKSDNILVDERTGDIIFCDMDNARVRCYPVDIKSRDTMRYYEIYGQMDQTVDAYMHNLLTLQQLGYKDEIPEYYSDIILRLKRGPAPTGFKQTAIPILESMTSPESFNGKYLAKHIKR